MVAEIPNAVNLVDYWVARRLLRDGMILLCRPRCPESQVIAWETQSPYSHVAMCGRAGSALMVGETLEHHDARLVCLREQVRQYPGCWDVYEVRADKFPFYCAAAAWGFICHASGARYGWRHCSRVWARRHFGELVPPIKNSDDPQFPRNCSALVHAAMRTSSGPRIKAWDCDVVPGDLADPFYTRYLMTLGWNEATDARCA